MILLQILGAFMIVFGVYGMFEASIMFKKGVGVYDAEIIDEVEDELYDNTGGLKTRFFKVYRYEVDGKGVVLRSERAMRRITDTVGRKTVIYVDAKKRRAVEKKDAVLNGIWGAVLFILGVILIALVLWIKLNVEGAAV